jgi:uncharacterized protein YqhQ
MSNRVHYGGQAVIEGVMIRGQKAVVTAVRQPNGEINLDTQYLANIYHGRLRKFPFIRGMIALIEALNLGLKSLLHSANIAIEEERQTSSGFLLWSAVVIALIFAIALFFIAPLFLTRLLSNYLNSSIIFHLIEGIIRLSIFIGYLKLITLMPDIRRVFAYHGAEHKVINAYENDEQLVIANIKKYNTAHQRCGTSFIFIVLIIAIFIFTLVGQTSVWLMILFRILFIPIIASVSYEIIYLGANHANSHWAKIIAAPGLIMQRLTTNEPDEDQIEVALLALQKVIEIENPEGESE